MYQLHPDQKFYRGKVRDTYTVGDRLVMITSDRISAFDHILPAEIPHKGAVLNGIATYFLRHTEDIVPNWLESTPHRQVSCGKACEPFRVEFVVRGYLAGHAWREYKAGRRNICGQAMPEGMVESQAFPRPLLTPSTKADTGHDEDISAEEVVRQGIMSKEHFDKAAAYALALYTRGTEMARERGLILVDTKYEFGLYHGEVTLIDEVHTPDSSRYYILENYHENLSSGQAQKQLSKEFVREWLMEQGFQGLEGQKMPDIPETFVQKVSERYLDLHSRLTGQELKIEEEKVSMAEAARNYLAEA